MDAGWIIGPGRTGRQAGDATRMAGTRWTGELSVGVEDMDAQHKVLIQLMGDLIRATASGQAVDVPATAAMIDRLMLKSMEHFAAEETLIIRSGCTDYVKHRKDHQLFLDKLASCKEAVGDGATSIRSYTANFLMAWFLDHIEGTDKHYGPFVNAMALL